MDGYVKKDDVLKIIFDSRDVDLCEKSDFEELVGCISNLPSADVVPREKYKAVVEQMNKLADMIIKIKEIVGARNG